ncbi:MAG: aminotransferase class I/II-fold pyridoxal phosphate-dependent enzyme [Rubrobacteraceae bacterium]
MRTSPKELAIFGGPPAFEEKLHVGRPNIGDRDRLMGRIGEVLDNRWLTNDGPLVREFEDRVAELVGVKHCIATCNATVGLEIAVRAAELTGEVIIPSLTFIATAHALEWSGLTPVFCDVDPATHNIDPARAEALVTPRTSAILGVHLWGRPCDTEALEDIAHRHGLKLMFDAAHAFGCSRGGRMVGSFGDAEVFSFHATKFLNTFEGGAVVTNDDDLAGRVRRMKNFGFVEYDEVAEAGTNGKMNEVCAAQGLTSLESLDEFVATNHRNYELYRSELESLPGIRLAAYDDAESNNYQYLVLEVDEEEAGIGRDDLIQVLWAENVLARRYFYPGCHRMEPYRSRGPQARLPVTEDLAEKLVTLPTGTTIGPGEVSGICGILHDAVRIGAEVRQRLAG